MTECRHSTATRFDVLSKLVRPSQARSANEPRSEFGSVAFRAVAIRALCAENSGDMRAGYLGRRNTSAIDLNAFGQERRWGDSGRFDDAVFGKFRVQMFSHQVCVLFGQGRAPADHLGDFGLPLGQREALLFDHFRAMAGCAVKREPLIEKLSAFGGVQIDNVVQ